MNRNVPGFATATPARRFVGYVLEVLVAMFTFGIGWLIWLAIVAPRGQSPGKALVGIYILTRDGRVAGAGMVWARELLVKGVLFWLINIITLGLAWFIGSLWCLWDPDRQCLWDKIVGGYVGRPTGMAVAGSFGGSVSAVPSGTAGTAADLRELRKLLDDGIITPEEYESRRSRLVNRL